MNIPALVLMAIFFSVPGLLAFGQIFLSSSMGGAIVAFVLALFLLGTAAYFLVIAWRQAAIDKFLAARPGFRPPPPRPGFKKAFLITLALFSPLILASLFTVFFFAHGVLISLAAATWVGWMNAMWQATRHPAPAMRHTVR